MGGPLQSVSSIFPDVARLDSSVVPDSVNNMMSNPISYLNDDKAYASSNMGGLNIASNSKNTACNNSLPPQVETVDSNEQQDNWKAEWLEKSHGGSQASRLRIYQSSNI